MTRRDYELIARVLRETSVPTASGSEKHRDCIAAYAEAFAVELAAANTRFDRERFLKACGHWKHA